MSERGGMDALLRARDELSREEENEREGDGKGRAESDERRIWTVIEEGERENDAT